jgi:hypothetical protein
MRIAATGVALVVLLTGSVEGVQLSRGYSLSECIQASPVIVLGKVQSLEDQQEEGVLRTRVLRVFKGKLAFDEAGAWTHGKTPDAIAIADPVFHSERNGTLKDGPVTIEQGGTYLFFLWSIPNPKYQYCVPFPGDGVILPSGPVNVEIQRQVEKAQSDTKLTETKVLEMADRLAAERRSKDKTFDLTSFSRNAEFDGHSKRWRVYYMLAPELRDLRLPTGSDHFSIQIDDRTGEMKYFGGR